MHVQKQRFIFDHAPKSAEVTISCILFDLLGESYVLVATSKPHFKTIKAAGSRKLLASHFWVINSDQLSDELYYAAFIRDKIDLFYPSTTLIVLLALALLTLRILLLKSLLFSNISIIQRQQSSIVSLTSAWYILHNGCVMILTKLTDEQLCNAACGCQLIFRPMYRNTRRASPYRFGTADPQSPMSNST